MAAPKWSEISQALEEKRRELVLTGKDVALRVEKNGLDDALYSLELLNFLEISNVGLRSISSDVGKLDSLVNLVLRSNKLESLPGSIGQLKTLHVLDVSRNELTELPNEIGDLSELHTFDASSNQISSLPDTFSKLEKLTVFHVSTNKLTNIDIVLSDKMSVHLSEIVASGNEIDSISFDISCLHVLKKIDMSSNKIFELPASLAECGKLRDLDFKNNPLRDRRLAKLVQQSKGHKAILDYVHTNGAKPDQEAGDRRGQKKGKKKGGGRKKKGADGGDAVNDLVTEMIRVLTVRANEEGEGTVEVTATKAAAGVRPYIVCCIVRDVNLDQGNMFKKFISAQTKLHDGPLCAKRTKATIATHDLSLIKAPLKYDARIPNKIEILPLGRKQSVTAQALVAKLHKEADDLRKEMKRNSVSGIHKYLDLLDGHQTYPCLLDTEGSVISFPPITNSDISKISKSTTNVFIEVTSSTDLATCKQVMDALIVNMVELGMSNTENTTSKDGGEAAATNERGPLIVQQVRVLEDDGGLRVVYPSRTDLNIDGIKVARS